MNLKSRSSPEAWKFVYGEKPNALGDVFFMKHNTELQRSELTIFPRMLLSGVVPHLEIFYMDEGFGLEHSIGGWFKPILETFPGGKVVSRKSSQNMRNPIANKDVVEVERAGRCSGKTIFSSTKKIFMTEFEKIKELVWNAKKELRRTSGLAG